jgi:anti-sigma-K factor RskA
MAMTKLEFIELCPAFALGALEAEERSRFLDALAVADEEMLTAFAEATQAAENLSLATPSAVPSATVKDRLMAEIKPHVVSIRKPQKPAENSWLDRLFEAFNPPRLRFVAPALVLLSLGLVSYTIYLRNTLGRQSVALKGSAQRIVALEDSLSQKNAMLAVLSSKDMHLVSMSGLDVNPSGYGKILWDPVRKIAVLHVSLPPEAADKDYQLWVIRDKKPVDAGVFQVRYSGQDGALYKIDHLVETDKNHINAFAVTLEPKGGVPQPTGKMYLLGSTLL